MTLAGDILIGTSAPLKNKSSDDLGNRRDSADGMNPMDKSIPDRVLSADDDGANRITSHDLAYGRRTGPVLNRPEELSSSPSENVHLSSINETNATDNFTFSMAIIFLVMIFLYIIYWCMKRKTRLTAAVRAYKSVTTSDEIIAPVPPQYNPTRTHSNENNTLNRPTASVFTMNETNRPRHAQRSSNIELNITRDIAEPDGGAVGTSCAHLSKNSTRKVSAE